MANRGGRLEPEAVVNDVRHNIGHFDADPYLRLGDADSAHGVLFGELAGFGDVAVKAFTRKGKAITESDNLRIVNERGFEALEPLLVAEGGLAAYLITRRYDGLRHLGQAQWRASVASRRIGSVIIPTLTEAGGTFADWHNAGIYHGDAQIKNVAYNEKGEAVFIDAEKTQFSSGRRMDVERGDKDLRHFGVTTLSRGMLDDRSVGYRAGFLDGNFLDSYFDTLRADASPISADERRAVIRDYWMEALKRAWTPAWALAGMEAAEQAA